MMALQELPDTLQELPDTSTGNPNDPTFSGDMLIGIYYNTDDFFL
jgi:hypothetical protein